MINCCNHTKTDKKCIRKSDKRVFDLSRKFSRKKRRKAKGFTMRASCAPYKDCFNGRGIKQKGGPKSVKTYFAGGCFWGIEKKLNQIDGVISTKVGYMGGKMKNPSYQDVCHKDTEHAETVEVLYDSNKVSYSDILKKYEIMRDKNIKKSQYRSIVFYTSSSQRNTANKFYADLRVETKNAKSFKFYSAEDYHQKYSFQKTCNQLNTENVDVFNLICKNNSQDAEDKYTGKYLDFKETGIYLCSCCGQNLYHSKDKYDSDSGWPAFSKSYSEKNILYSPHNNEIRCSNCGLHLGHRTFDGPTVTKIHDCINSACLAFQGKKVRKTKKKGGGIKTKKRFLYNPDNPKKSFDVYIDKNPKDTIPIKYTTLGDVKNTIKKLESLYKKDKYTHKRIWQVGMILYVRLKVLKSKKPQEFKLAERYFKHLGKRSKIKHKDKKEELKQRQKFTFKI